MNELRAPSGPDGAPSLDNFFFATHPEPEAAAQAVAVAQWVRRTWRLTGRPLPLERLHVSLHGLGQYADTPPWLVEAADAVARQVAARPFDVAFNAVAKFGGQHGRSAVALRGDDGTIGMERLQAELGMALQRAGLRHSPIAGYVPHMTLLYADRPGFDEIPVETIRWTVREFVLVRSLVGRSRHLILMRWALTA